MKLEDVSRLLGCTVHCAPEGWESRKTGAVYAGDLMSDVLVNEGDAALLLTGLNSEQVIRTADIVDACGVVLINNKVPQKALIALAEETSIALLSSPLSMYRACGILGNFENGA